MAPIATPRLEIEALGHLHILGNSQPLKRSNDLKRELMLVYLAANPQPQARRAMAQLLWSYAEDKVALSNLRSLLTRMRQEGLADYLVADRTTVSLASGVALEFDVDRFRTAMATLTAHDLPALIRIMELYQGEFLKGIALRDQPELEEWILTNQRELQSLAVVGYQRAIALAQAGGETGPAVTLARQLLEITPYDDDNHELYVRALIADRQPGEALRHYAEYTRILEQELGIRGATPSLTALVETVRNQTIAQPPVQTTAADAAALPTAAIAPPMKTAARFVGPRPARVLVGRQADLAQLRRWLEAGTGRLITITGLGGTGKTHLALTLAESVAPYFADGVYFVDLTAEQSSSEQSEDQVAERVVQAMGRTLGVSFTGRQSLEEELLADLAPRHACLILDNFEQLLPAAPLLNRLLARAPQLMIVVTSRIRLNISHEQVFPLGGLCVPASNADIAMKNSPAVRLFVTEVQRRVRDYEPTTADVHAIARICQQVGGQPLALLLAASWSEHYALHELAENLEDGLDLLQSSAVDVPDRHGAIETVLASSWRRLTPREQTTLADLSVLASPFSRDAAQHVAGATVAQMGGLLRWSLVEGAGPGQYRLHPLVRQFAGAQLTQMRDDRSERAAARHAAYFGGWFLEKAAKRDERAAVLTYYGNFQRALEWYVEHDPEWMIQHLDRLDAFWSNAGFLTEGRAWLRKLCDRTDPAQHAHALVLQKLGKYAQQQQDFGRAETLLLEARTIFEEQGDRVNLAATSELLGWTLFDQPSQRLDAIVHFEGVLAFEQAANNPEAVTRLLWALGTCHIWCDLDVAKKYLEEALPLVRSLQNETLEKAIYAGLVQVAHERSDIVTQRHLYDILSALLRQHIGSYHEAWLLLEMIKQAIYLGHFDEAEAYIARAEAGFKAMKIARGTLLVQCSSAQLALLRGQRQHACRQFIACILEGDALPDEEAVASSLLGLALMELENDRRSASVALLAQAQAYGDRYPVALTYSQRAAIAHHSAALRQELGDAEFCRQWQFGYEGRLLDICAPYRSLDDHAPLTSVAD